MCSCDVIFPNLSAVILAGGLGTRLRTVIADRPKALAEIAGRPFIYYLLDQLAEKSIKKVVLCTGYLGEQIREELGDTYRQMDLQYSQENEPRGTAGSLRLALPLITTDTALVMNGDSYCGLDLLDFWRFHTENDHSATIALTHVGDTSRYGNVDFDETGRIRKFVEKKEAIGAGWVSAGIYLLSKNLIATIPEGKPVSIEKETFPLWVRSGLFAYCSNTEFIDIGTPESYTLANTFFTGEKSWI